VRQGSSFGDAKLDDAAPHLAGLHRGASWRCQRVDRGAGGFRWGRPGAWRTSKRAGPRGKFKDAKDRLDEVGDEPTNWKENDRRSLNTWTHSRAKSASAKSFMSIERGSHRHDLMRHRPAARRRPLKLLRLRRPEWAKLAEERASRERMAVMERAKLGARTRPDRGRDQGTHDRYWPGRDPQE